MCRVPKAVDFAHSVAPRMWRSGTSRQAEDHSRMAKPLCVLILPSIAPTGLQTRAMPVRFTSDYDSCT